MTEATRAAEDEDRLHLATRKAAASAPNTTAQTMRAILKGGLEALVVCMMKSSAHGAGPAREEIALDDQ
jgi:hypothetical protein